MADQQITFEEAEEDRAENAALAKLWDKYGGAQEILELLDEGERATCLIVAIQLVCEEMLAKKSHYIPVEALLLTIERRMRPDEFTEDNT